MYTSSKYQVFGCMAGLLSLFLFFSCNSGSRKESPVQGGTAQDTAVQEAPAKAAVEASSQDDQTIKDFITHMYNNTLYIDYEFLEKHCTRNLLDKLEADNDYDTEGVAYAVWDFRTNAQDGKPDSNGLSEVISIESSGDGWYTYEFYDGGWHGKNRLKCFIQDGQVMMDALEKIYDELDELYKEEQE